MELSPIFSLPYDVDGDEPGISIRGDVGDVAPLPDAIEVALVSLTPTTVQNDQTADENNVSATTFTPGATDCSVTFVAPFSGQVEVFVGFYANADSAGTLGTQIFCGFEVRVTNVGGAQVFETANTQSAVIIPHTAGQNYHNEKSFMVTGLTAGATYFARTLHKVVTGSDVDIVHRYIRVRPAT